MGGRQNNSDSYASNNRSEYDTNTNHSNIVKSASSNIDKSLTYPIVGSNQKKFYNDHTATSRPDKGDDYYGQDASYKQNSPSYQNNGDGTVTDLNTGLMWQKAFKKIEWNNAATDAKRATTGGYTDWRVPTIKESYSLILFNGSTGTGRPNSRSAPSNAIPYIATNYFDFEYGTGNRYIDAQYITSTSYLGKIMNNQEGFFGVNFADGRIKCYPKQGNRNSRKWYVRYVRGSKDYGKNKFVDNRDGTISDKTTGLMWLQTDSGNTKFQSILSRFIRKDGSMNWKEALNFCENMNFAGKSDWRLPTAKELQSLVNYNRSPSATMSPAIDPIFKATEIKDEGKSRNYPFYWSSTTHLDGRELGRNAVYVAFGEALGFMRSRYSSDYKLMDVHGAGAQRSDPKIGNPSDHPKGFGPQGDVRRIFNYVRPVRDIK
ncbi:MAG: DUF1566 domain-containing protein [Desulfobacterales bacterium]|nr:DUF1566 domain-containing protein [Desulfobacterales bacterium]MCP4159625.1 DUF1566 domain-containing protein [Deltaproteobacteria bacterium]